MLLHTLLLTVAAPAATPTIATIAAPVPLVVVDEADDAIQAAGEDTAKLAELASGWAEASNEDAARRAWRRILEIDADHEGARKGLRHHQYGGEWHETYAALAQARRAEAKRRFEAEGVVPFGDEWVKAEDLPFRRMHWEKLDDGTWAPPGTRDRFAAEKANLANGYEQQHCTWIAPSEFDQWRKGLWKVGDEWLDLAAANEAHAQIGAWWQVPGERFIALTTVPEEHTRWVVWWADQTHADLNRIFGLEPKAKPEFVVLDSISQYNDFSAGNPAEGRAPADANGYSSVHYAYFTDGWIDTTGPAAQFKGTGAAYYDVNDPALKPFGQHAVRHAAALAWLEAVDPSWNAVSLMMTSPGAGFPDARYWGEKRIPRWMRYGAAAYCERFFEDPNVGEDGDPLWARKWALENLKNGEPMDSIEDVIALQFDTNDPPKSTRLIHEAGLVVHYMIDGKDKKVGKAFDAYRNALTAGEDVSEEITDLEEALVKAEKKIAKFGGL